jgi:hypothetical protein
MKKPSLYNNITVKKDSINGGKCQKMALKAVFYGKNEEIWTK